MVATFSNGQIVAVPNCVGVFTGIVLLIWGIRLLARPKTARGFTRTVFVFTHLECLCASVRSLGHYQG